MVEEIVEPRSVYFVFSDTARQANRSRGQDFSKSLTSAECRRNRTKKKFLWEIVATRCIHADVSKQVLVVSGLVIVVDLARRHGLEL